jgi:hypothetical protein
MTTALFRIHVGEKSFYSNYILGIISNKEIHAQEQLL